MIFRRQGTCLTRRMPYWVILQLRAPRQSQIIRPKRATHCTLNICKPYCNTRRLPPLIAAATAGREGRKGRKGRKEGRKRNICLLASLAPAMFSAWREEHPRLSAATPASVTLPTRATFNDSKPGQCLPKAKRAPSCRPGARWNGGDRKGGALSSLD